MKKVYLLRSLNCLSWSYAYLGLIYALYFIYFIVVPSYKNDNRLSLPMYIVFNLSFLYFFSQGYFNLIRTTFTRVKLNSNKDKFCQICCKYLCERSYHCYVCQQCILQRDHHCFFVSTCIGKHNQKYFILMLGHLIISHLIGYAFVAEFLWQEVGGLRLISIPKVLFFNIGYILGFVETKWQAWICLHHYLVYFDVAFISRLFYQIMRRSLNGQTQYEERKMIRKNKQNFKQIFGDNLWKLFIPFSRL